MNMMTKEYKTHVKSVRAWQRDIEKTVRDFSRRSLFIEIEHVLTCYGHLSIYVRVGGQSKVTVELMNYIRSLAPLNDGNAYRNYDEFDPGYDEQDEWTPEIEFVVW